ncbi:MAG: GIY-YIG nuclease family protein [Caldilineaceae bacterium]|nr:GIY-YIG nuclease family protein [Caldilineaceae bacterium]
MQEQRRAVIVMGDAGVQGVYLLRIALPTALTLTFGRFRGGRPFDLPAGDYLYVGSAMGQRGSATLAARLLRHATRSGDQPPHSIRTELAAALDTDAATAAPQPPPTKRCRWHIDFLLDQPMVALIQVYVLRTPDRMEQPLADWLLQEPATDVIVPGLGASDHPGATHLVRVTASAAWWDTLPDSALSMLFS